MAYRMNGREYPDIKTAYKAEKKGKYSDEYKKKYSKSNYQKESSVGDKSKGTIIKTSGKKTPTQQKMSADSIIDWSKPMMVVDSIISDSDLKTFYRTPTDKDDPEYQILKTVGLIKEDKTPKQVVEYAQSEKKGLPIWVWAILAFLGFKVLT